MRSRAIVKKVDAEKCLSGGMVNLGLGMERNHVKDFSRHNESNRTVQATPPPRNPVRPSIRDSSRAPPLHMAEPIALLESQLSAHTKTRRYLQECDFEGRPFRSSSPDHGECYLVFTGLERTGHDLGTLNVTALFGINGTQQIAKATSPLQARAFPSRCGSCVQRGATGVFRFRFSSASLDARSAVQGHASKGL